MIHVAISLSDDVEAALKARVREGGYSDIADYVRALIETDVAPGNSWEVTPEIAAAIDEGERSGISSRSLDEIFAEARSQFSAEQI